jgi:hypothetical protein
MDNKELLDQLYYSPASGISYSSPLKFYKFLQKNGYPISFNKVKEYLSHQQGHQQSQQDHGGNLLPRHFSRRYIQPSRPGSLAIDTMYLNKIKAAFSYAFIGVDMFSRRIYLKFLRQLNANTTLRAFCSVQAEAKKGDYPIHQVFSDAG